jgi:hypothetical protein
MSRLPMSGKELVYLVGLTALVLAGFVGAAYIVAAILWGL